jgi:DNA-binding transcriptional LysR family regulator
MAHPVDWTSLEVRHLLAFVAVIEEGSFGAAASRLGYSQPGVSHQIAALERIVGRTLVVRRGGDGVVPTGAGRLLVPRARTIIAECRGARLALADLAAKEEGADRMFRAAGAGAVR